MSKPMTDPKVSEKEMIDALNCAWECEWPEWCVRFPEGKKCKEAKDAIRSAIEERGRMREAMGELKNLADLALPPGVVADDIIHEKLIELAYFVRDFKINGEEGEK